MNVYVLLVNSNFENKLETHTHRFCVCVDENNFRLLEIKIFNTRECRKPV